MRRINQIIENEIGGVLRAIEFIYREAGVNRPLKSSDNKTDNQNKTDYRNQVNKVANAIKEIITSLKNPNAQPARTITNHQPASALAGIPKTLKISFNWAAEWICSGLHKKRSGI
jgi:hypothetical protein